jgi:hypothetical protein
MIPTYKSGTIPAGGTITVNVGGWPAPFTATLNSTAAGRAIAFSSSPTGAPAPATPDTTATGWINYAFLAPVCLITFTGNVGDAYEVR